MGDTLLLGALALASRLLVVWWAAARFVPAADGHYYDVLTRRLAAGHGYSWLWPDGAVTYAAHYPVGLPALVAPWYALFGARPWLAMVVNALFGMLLVMAVHRMLLPHKWRAVAAAGALLVCLHPGLLWYTAAFMTEGITASLLVMAALVAACARRPGTVQRRWAMGVLLGLLLGATTLVRPQSLLLAPLFAGLMVRHRWRRRIAMVLVTSVALLVVVLPWTWRNCQRMDRCALVSMNGGWNLLIGTQPQGRGGWSELRTPSACRKVYDEARKDSCFQHAALVRIEQAPLAWLRLIPAKLSVTFDYCGAPGWYLHESNAAAFGERAKWWLGAIELLYERVLLALSLLLLLPTGEGRQGGTGRRWRAAGRGMCLAIALGCCFARPAWVAVLLLVLGLGLRRAPPWRLPVVYGAALLVLLTTALVHAVFFGAGRYQLVVLPWFSVLAPLGVVRARGFWRRMMARWGSGRAYGSR